MRPLPFFAAAAWAALMLRPAMAQPAPLTPSLMMLNGSHLRYAAAQVIMGNATFAPAYAALLSRATGYLNDELETVVNKTTVPPSGDKRSYASWAFYWWPCNYNSSGVVDPSTGVALPLWPIPATATCNTTTGLPWVQHDGYPSGRLMNLDDSDDSPRLASATNKATTLAYAWYFSRNTDYAFKAAAFLRTFFLSPVTGMLPNLDYAQAIPGVNVGRGVGIIDTRNTLTSMLDAITVLGLCPEAWSTGDMAAMRTWISRYTLWLTTSRNGLDEVRSGGGLTRGRGTATATCRCALLCASRCTYLP